MRLKRNRPGSTECQPGKRSVVTIGNFDGVHRGHQALVSRCRKHAGVADAVAVVTFEPLPLAFFRPEHAPARLTTVYQKLSLLQASGVDICWQLRFDQQLAQLSPGDFVQQVLIDGLAARHVVVGEDFRFGHQRAGTLELLGKLGQDGGFSVEAFPAIKETGQRISSTAIREALAQANFERAGALLGRPFRMEGRVVAGQKLGRNLGYPTANLRVRAHPCPLQGIFAVFARCQDSQGTSTWQAGVSSLGWRPTVGGKDQLLEVHLFDFDADLYGRRLEVEFVAKLRDESHFEDIDSLVVQMKLDEQQAREILAKQESPHAGEQA